MENAKIINIKENSITNETKYITHQNKINLINNRKKTQDPFIV